MNLAEIRSKYPQYKDVPDEELAGRLYDKYYANSGRSREEVFERLGVTKPDTTFEFGEMVRNIPGSAARVAGDVWTAVSSPIDTARAVGTVAQSFGNKLGRNAAEFVQGVEMEPMPEHSEAAANAVGSAIKGRYGSLDALKQTVEDDPVGFLVDVSGAGSATRIPAVARVAGAVDPLTGAAKAGQAVARAVIPENAAAKLYESAAKFSTTLPQAKREGLVRTALEHGILPTQKGVKRVSGRIDVLNNQLDDLIDQATKTGSQIPVGAVFQHLNELRKRKSGVKIESDADLAAIDKIAGGFHQSLKGRKTVTPEELQAFKVDAYNKINWDAKRMTGTPIKEDTYKAMARGAKDAIAKEIPEASEINKLLGELYELQPHLIRAANRIDNRNLISLDTSVKTGAGVAGGAALDATGTGAALGFALSMLGNPKVKPRIAMTLKRLRDGDVEWINRNLGDPAVRAGLVLAGRSEEIVSATSDGAQ